MTVRIVTDSACDLPAEVIAENGITVVPLYVNFGSESYLDGVEMSRGEFYARLPSALPPPATSAPGTATFTGIYRRLIDEGASGILSIHIGSALSNVCNVARMAAASIGEVPVRVLDSGQITLGTGLLAAQAAVLAASGAALDSIVASVETLAKRMHSIAALDTLEYLRRGGRVSLLKFSVGTLLQIKPMLKMHAGKIVTDRARTSGGAIRKLLDLAARLGPLESIALVHASALDRLEQLRREVEARFPGVPIRMVGEVAPVVGAHVGPRSVGVICVKAPAAGLEGS
ncbi:MAG: DegV family protein [Chloroflexi bacterium]|nr:DegV family protein [Chloroflexota bacterium]